MIRSIGGLTAAMSLLLCPSVLAAGPANVTVRVEGREQTLVEEVRLATAATPVNKSGKAGEDCSGTSVAGALEKATAGDWGGSWSADFNTYFLDTIKGEKHSGEPDYWTFWVNHKAAVQGICQVELQEGDEVLFFLDYCEFDSNTFQCTNEPVLPLELRLPGQGKRGDIVTATVVRHTASGESQRVQGARVIGPGYDATTGPDGTVQVFLASSGQLKLRAEKPNAARSAHETICVSEGTDGTCGTADQRPPVSRIEGIVDSRRFGADSGPRVLQGEIEPDASGLADVRLRLTRRDGRGRCSYFSGRLERFRAIRCGRGHYFRVGDRAEWSYLLPSKLTEGRYVLDAVAVDKAGNRTPLARGSSRVVFFVG